MQKKRENNPGREEVKRALHSLEKSGLEGKSKITRIETGRQKQPQAGNARQKDNKRAYANELQAGLKTGPGSGNLLLGETASPMLIFGSQQPLHPITRSHIDKLSVDKKWKIQINRLDSTQ